MQKCYPYIFPARSHNPQHGHGSAFLRHACSFSARVSVLRGMNTFHCLAIATSVLTLASCGDSKDDARQLLLRNGVVQSVLDIKEPAGTAAFFKAADQGEWDIVNAFCTAGLDMDTATDNSGYTALVKAVAMGKTDCARGLLDAGAGVDARDTEGHTPLMWAAHTGHADCVKLLLDAKANVNAEDPAGMTPVMSAAAGGSTECVKLLLDAGANANARDKEGWSALRYATGNGHTKVAEQLKAAGAKE